MVSLSAVLPLPHRSVWPSRASAADAEPVDWRAAHEAVRRAGGWRAYAREPGQEMPSEKAADVPKYGEPAEPHHHGDRP